MIRRLFAEVAAPKSSRSTRATLQTPQRCIPGDAGAMDSAADDEEVDVLLASR